jgi:UDP-N-acetylmuramoyl-L-alanyl-D-glutamate--2,6-diaminopimelate ligase
VTGSLCAVSSPSGVRPTRVAPRSASNLAALLGVSALGVAELARDAMVTGVTLHSAQVRPGDLYAALPGARDHGARYAAEAARRGATAVLTDPAGSDLAAAAGLPILVVPDPRSRLGELAAAIYGRPSDDLLLIGVTGTNGKTTTSYLVEAGLRADGRRTGLVGTIETRIGDEALTSVRTTPESSDLQAMLAVMRERNVDAVAMEVSSHGLALGRIDGMHFGVGIFTNLGRDHLDFHGTIDAYFDAKATLFTPQRSRAGAVNVDDAYGRKLVRRATVPVTTYSARGADGADWRAQHVALHTDGSTFTALGPGGLTVAVATHLPGAFNVQNALSALVGLVLAGVPPERAAAGIAAVSGVPGRMERVDAGQPFTALVDYAHTPDAVETLLAAVRAVTAGRIVCVLGCGGDRDQAKRPEMGAAAARGADVAVLTSDNPRSEDPATILDAMLEGALSVPSDDRAELIVDLDRAAAITAAVRLARSGDAVVVAGKGHEQGQEIGGVIRPFDDRSVLRAALMERVGSEARTC